MDTSFWITRYQTANGSVLVNEKILLTKQIYLFTITTSFLYFWFSKNHLSRSFEKYEIPILVNAFSLISLLKQIGQ